MLKCHQKQQSRAAATATSSGGLRRRGTARSGGDVDDLAGGSQRTLPSTTGSSGLTDGDRVTGARVASRLGAPVTCRRLDRRSANTAVPQEAVRCPERWCVRNVGSHHAVTR